MKFYGRVESGKPKINNLDKYSKFFESLEEGEEFEITLKAVKDNRTLKMNNLYWRWLTDLSLHSGYSKRELHHKFKEELLCLEMYENEQNCPSTADLTIEEFSIYLEGVARLSSEWFSFVLQA